MTVLHWIILLSSLLTKYGHGEHHHAFYVSEEFIVNASTKEVQDFYTDLFRFGDAHPLIKKVTCITTTAYCYKYLIHEKPFSWLPMYIDYEAEILNPDYKKKVIYKISEIPFLQPTIVYEFEAISPVVTRITSSVEVQGSWLLRKLLAKKILNAQKAVVKKGFADGSDPK